MCAVGHVPDAYGFVVGGGGDVTGVGGECDVGDALVVADEFVEEGAGGCGPGAGGLVGGGGGDEGSVVGEFDAGDGAFVAG